MPILSFPPAQRPKPARLQYDAKTGEPLYPFAPQDYQKIEIVGFRLENGEYLPVKIFVSNPLEAGTIDVQPQKRQRLWWQLAVAGLMGLFVGLVL